MTTKRQMRKLVRPLFERHPDLALIGSEAIWITPAHHIARQIRIVRSSRAHYFTLQWCLTELFLPEAIAVDGYGWCYEGIGRSHNGGGIWSWSDPTMADDFLVRTEADCLPLLRSLDSFEAIIAFARKHPEAQWCLGRHWPLITDIALGRLDAARAVWSQIGRHYVTGEVLQEPALQLSYDRYCEIGPPLLADDRAALAKILHRWEAENVVGTVAEPHWQPTPFPLEADPA